MLFSKAKSFFISALKQPLTTVVILGVVISITSGNVSFAEDVLDVDTPQAKTTAEKPVVEKIALNNETLENMSPETRKELKRIAGSMHEQARIISNELKDDQEMALTDISLLWQAAVENSGTIRLAIDKLSRRDETGKPLQKESFTKNIARNALRLGGAAASAVTASPAAVMSGGAIEDLLLNSPTSSAYAQVTDADMVILAKEIEKLQSEVITQYYQYRNTQDRFKMAQEARETMNRYFDDMMSEKKLPESTKMRAEMMLETARQEELKAKQHFLNARSELAFTVGSDVIEAMEASHSQLL